MKFREIRQGGRGGGMLFSRELSDPNKFHFDLQFIIYLDPDSYLKFDNKYEYVIKLDQILNNIFVWDGMTS